MLLSPFYPFLSTDITSPDSIIGTPSVSVHSPISNNKPFESISPEPISNDSLYSLSESVAPKIETTIEENVESKITQIKIESAIEEISGEEDNQQTVEMDISSSPIDPTTITDLSKDEGNIELSSDAGDKSLLLSPCNDGNSKPGGAKRKMSLLEYRSRARKPEQIQRKPPSQEAAPQPHISSIITSPTPPPSAVLNTPPTNNPPSHSFLSYSSSFLSGSTNRITKPLGETGTCIK